MGEYDYDRLHGLVLESNMIKNIICCGFTRNKVFHASGELEKHDEKCDKERYGNCGAIDG